MSIVFVFLLAYMLLLSYFFFCFVFLWYVYDRFGLILGLIHSAIWALAAFYLAALIYGMILVFGQVSYYFQLRFDQLDPKLRYLKTRYYGDIKTQLKEILQEFDSLFSLIYEYNKF